MCLDKVYAGKPAEKGVGYKVFRKKENILHGELQGDDKKPRSTRAWLKANDYSSQYDREWKLSHKLIQIDSDSWYRPGWHIFKDLESAKIWKENVPEEPDRIIKKVKYKNAHTEGKQSIREFENEASIYGDVIIADEIYIYKKEIK